jgi:hypothetical protein
MSPAQKKAQANFKKAIAYRKKTGCTLKQAFAHAKGEKVGTIKKKAIKKAVHKKVIHKKAAKKVVRKKIRGIATKSKTHTDYNKPTVNIQIGAIKKGSKYIHFKGYLIEKKPETINGKKKHLFICHELGVVAETLANCKSRINYIIK